MKRKRKSWILIMIGLLGIGLFIYMQIAVSPIIKDLATASVSNKASSVINDSIEVLLRDGEVDYDRIIFLEKDIQGNITALKTNIAEINRLKSQTLSTVDRLLLDLDVSEIGIPMGNFILPEIFSGSGPRLPVKIVSVSNSDAEFRNVFLEAGINQTTHQIMLDVAICMTVLTPVGTQSVSSVSSVMVAETVIVGNVPSSYVNFN